MIPKNRAVLVTGGAGFIGSHLCEALLDLTEGFVVAFDNFDPYYDPLIKEENLKKCKKNDRFRLVRGDIRSHSELESLFSLYDFSEVFHLAALAGVRPSILEPSRYVDTNLLGTQTLLDVMKQVPGIRLIFASSSSVYGNNSKIPFSESDSVDFPVSPYAATKKAGELLTHTYHHLYGMPIACIRFFTVYGPRQRPEMAIHHFTRLIDAGTPIPVFNQGHSLRDYTYIDDIIQGILGIWQTSFGYDVVNLGESRAVRTLDLIGLIEKNLGKTAQLKLLEAQPGDVDTTYADISKATTQYGYLPSYPIEKGIASFVEWYKTRKS